MNALNVPLRLAILLLPLLALTSCQTPLEIDTSESEQRIIETVTIIDEGACEALTPGQFGTVDEDGNFTPTKITQEDWLTLPVWARVKIIRDDNAHEDYCMGS